MLDPYLKGTITPAKGVSVTATYDAFWLATTSDFFYQANQSPRTAGGYGIHPQNSSFAGQELDLVATYTSSPMLQIQAGFAHYFTGDYVNQTFASLGGAHDANWYYIQAQLQF